MGEEKAGDTQTVEEVLAGGEHAASNENTTNGNSLDFTGGDTAVDQTPSPQVGDKYDPRPQEDGARRTIAYLLIGLLWLIVSGILILLGFSAISVDNLKDF